MRAWALTVVVRRLRLAWGLPAVVLAIAVLSCTLLSMLALSVQNAELGGVRTSLAELPAAESRVEVALDRPSVATVEAQDAADRAVQAVFAGAAGVSSRSVAVSDFGAAPQFDSDLAAFAYVTAPSSFDGLATLVSGAWPSTGDGAALPVALPEQAATAHGLAVGSTFTVRTGSTTSVNVDVVAIYRAVTGADAAADAAGFWNADPLQGGGDLRDFPKPGVTFYDPIEALGPLLVTQEALDGAAVPVQSFDLTYQPDFSNTDTALLTGLSDRVAGSDLTTAIGAVAAGVQVSTTLPASLVQVATALTVTRSTVAIIAILLALLAVAALGLAARLFAAARLDDAVLSRARGASARQSFALAGVEAVGIGLVSAVAGPVLAGSLVPLTFVGGGGGGGGPALPVWAVSAALALVFVGVLLAAAAFSPAGSAADAPRLKARQTRVPGVVRSGFDVGIVVVAVVLYVQLLHYRSPVRGVGTLALDPVLVAGPAAVLLAGALLAARLVPLLAHGIERVARRTGGLVATLVAWEFARRSRTATSVVLLLTVSIAVGTFSQSYLATWRQSQLDQAELAVGAPVVVPVDTGAGGGAGAGGGTAGGTGTDAGSGAARLEEGANGVSPVIRRSGRVSASSSAGLDGELPSGPPATVMAVPSAARELLTRGRLGALGGDTIDAGVGDAAARSSGIDLPASASGISLSAVVSAPASLADATVGLRVMIEDGSGLITVLDLGSVAVDGGPHTVQGALTGAVPGAGFTAPARLVGVQAVFSREDDAGEADGGAGGGTDGTGGDGTGAVASAAPDADATVTLSNLAALSPTSGGGAPTEERLSAAAAPYRGLSDVPFGDSPRVDVSPDALAVHVSVPGFLTSVGSTFSVVGWDEQADVPAVITEPLARTLGVQPGSRLTVVVNGALLGVQVTAVAPFAPGASGGALLTELGPSATATGPPPVIVVDEVALSRALAESGQTGPLVDEWWVDVAADQSASYVAAHPGVAGAAPVRSIQGLADTLLDGPLRVALPAALRLATLAGVIFGVVGFALHVSGSLRARRPELAHLRAIGVSRRQIVALIGAESALLAAIGSVFGVGLGVGLGLLVAPLIGVSPNGAPPLPQAVIVLPGLQIALLVAVFLAAVAAFVVPFAAFARSLDPARILRGGS